MAVQYLQIDRHNISEHFWKVVESIRHADYVALDTEFTGLKFAHDYSPSLCQWSPTQTLYSNYRLVCEQFQLLQLGISAFQWDSQQQKYKEQSFSFFLHPPGESLVATDSSSLGFLADNHFDFGRCYSRGLSPTQLETLVTEERWTELLTAEDPYSMLLKITQDVDAQDRRLEQLEGQQIHNSKPVVRQGHQVRQTVVEWANNPEISSLQVPILKGTWDWLNMNGWDQLVESLGVSATLTRTDSGYQLEIQRSTKNASADQMAQDYCSGRIEESKKPVNDCGVSPGTAVAMDTPAKLPQSFLQDLGVSMLILEIIRHRKPIVAHCCLFDLMYIYQNFIGKLPSEVAQFMSRLDSCFPTIYDTKLFVAKARSIDPDLKPNLGPAYDYLNNSPVFKNMFLRAHFDKLQLHDAGYDSSMCGAVFIYTALLLGVIKKPLQNHQDPLVTGFDPKSVLPLVQPYQGKLYTVFPTRVIDIRDVQSSEPTDTDQILCMKLSAELAGASLETLTSLIEQLTEVINKEHTFQFHKINQSDFYLEIKGGSLSRDMRILSELNTSFAGRCEFSTYENRAALSLDRLAVSRFGYC